VTWPVPALFAALSIASSLVVACATGSTTAVKYPRRKPGCAIAIIHEAVPPVREWDDIGLVEVGCYLDEGPGTCLTRLKAEGCRMGGDMIYDVPKRPARPNERAIVYRGHVAHSKTTAKPEPEEPAPASGPVVPIAAPATTEPEADAGVTVTADGAAADATLTP
jgi:hypothetical protein